MTVRKKPAKKKAKAKRKPKRKPALKMRGKAAKKKRTRPPVEIDPKDYSLTGGRYPIHDMAHALVSYRKLVKRSDSEGKRGLKKLLRRWKGIDVQEAKRERVVAELKRAKNAARKEQAKKEKRNGTRRKRTRLQK